MIDNTIKVTITPSLIDPETFKLTEEWNHGIGSTLNHVTTQVFSLREQAIRTALIALGWTPPRQHIIPPMPLDLGGHAPDCEAARMYTEPPRPGAIFRCTCGRLGK